MASQSTTILKDQVMSFQARKMPPGALYLHLTTLDGYFLLPWPLYYAWCLSNELTQD